MAVYPAGEPHTKYAYTGYKVLERFGGDLPERYEVVGLGEIRLEAENPEYQPIDGQGAQILGKVVAVVRRYD